MAHGLIHLIEFVVPWRIATLEGFRYRTDVLSTVEIGTTGVKALGPFWLVARVWVRDRRRSPAWRSAW